MTEPVRPLEALIATWRERQRKNEHDYYDNGAFGECADELAALLQAAAPPARWKGQRVRAFAEALGFDPDTGEKAAQPALTAELDVIQTVVRVTCGARNFNATLPVSDYQRIIALLSGFAYTRMDELESQAAAPPERVSEGNHVKRLIEEIASEHMTEAEVDAMLAGLPSDPKKLADYRRRLDAAIYADKAAPPAPTAEPACCNGQHEWSNQFGDDWTPEVGTLCDCRKRQWGVIGGDLAVAAPPAPTAEPVNWKASYHQACDDADAYKADAEKRLVKMEQNWRSCQHEIAYLRERLKDTRSAPPERVSEGKDECPQSDERPRPDETANQPSEVAAVEPREEPR